jgi:hypothetical protein
MKTVRTSEEALLSIEEIEAILLAENALAPESQNSVDQPMLVESTKGTVWWAQWLFYGVLFAEFLYFVLPR